MTNSATPHRIDVWHEKKTYIRNILHHQQTEPPHMSFTQHAPHFAATISAVLEEINWKERSHDRIVPEADTDWNENPSHTDHRLWVILSKSTLTGRKTKRKDIQLTKLHSRRDGDLDTGAPRFSKRPSHSTQVKLISCRWSSCAGFLRPVNVFVDLPMSQESRKFSPTSNHGIQSMTLDNLDADEIAALPERTHEAMFKLSLAQQHGAPHSLISKRENSRLVEEIDCRP